MGATFLKDRRDLLRKRNRNKESVTLDLTDPGDLELARELARRADVLVENFKPGGLAKLGLGYEVLAEENPGLVYTSHFGLRLGRRRDLPGYDFIVQAVGGLMSITGDPQGDAYKVGVALVDVLTAKDATIGILAALSERNSTGRGRRIEVNLLSSLQGALANQAQAYLGAGVTPTRLGNDHPSIVPYQLLATSDDPLAVAVGNDSQFAKLCSAIGNPELAADPRFVTNSARVKHRRELVQLLEDGLARAGATEWQDQLVSAGVPAGRVASIDEGIAYADTLGLEPTIQVHDTDGNVTGRQIRHPITWTPALPARTQAPPALGEHTEEVLEWLRQTKSKTFTSTLKVPPVPKSFMPRRDHIMTLAPSSADIEAVTALEPSDLISFDTLLTDEEIALRDRVRTYVREEIKPNIATWYEEARFPLEIVPDLAKLGLLGMHLKGYGCAGGTAVDYGLAAAELEAGDSGIRTFVSVQGSLAMSAISKHGSEEQKEEWLPQMAAGTAIGCFGLTEPTAGSDPSAMATFARRDGRDWILTGTKRWIGLANVAQVAVIWAQTDTGVRGFVVPTKTPGFTATPIEPKLSMRASVQCDITLNDVRLPADAVLPNVTGLRGPFACLNEARYGIAWGTMGAARDAFEDALDYSKHRLQFDRPLAGYQLTQQKLVNMALEINKGFLLALHLGRLKDAGKLQNHQISVGKLNNCREAIEICREARTILGGNGITLEHSPLRHANNLESVRTYEGTDEVHTLILGQKLTGIGAFR